MYAARLVGDAVLHTFLYDLCKAHLLRRHHSVARLVVNLYPTGHVPARLVGDMTVSICLESCRTA